MGAKIFGESSKRRVEYLIVLIDQETGVIAGLIDAHNITALRTAATSAMALDEILPRRPVTVGVLGSGLEASNHTSALAHIRSIAALKVFSPTASKRQSFADRFSEELGVDCSAVGSEREAVDGAAVIVAAARSRNEQPILHGDWLSPNAVIVSIGSTLPEQREIDHSVIAASTTIIVDAADEITEGTGDFLAASAHGVEFNDKLFDLHALVAGDLKSRLERSGIVMFKSTGAALQDIAVAELAYRKSVEQGLATELPIKFETKQN